MEDRPNPNNDQADDDSDQGRGHKGNLNKEDLASHQRAEDDDSLEFVVSEKVSDDREFVGGRKRFGDDGNDTDELDIEEPSDLMEKRAVVQSDGRQLRLTDNDGPPLPGEALPIGSPDEQSEPPESGSSYQPPTGQQGEVRKLSAQEVESIEKDLYRGDSYLTDQEKEDLIKKMSKLDGSAGDAPENAAAKPLPGATRQGVMADLSKPKMAKRGRGIAYFYKNYIQLMGSQELRAEDELHINNRCYELKPKRFDTKSVLAIGAVLFALLLFFIGSQLVSRAGARQGEIVGMVLNNAGKPHVKGATIKLPELGRSATSTSQGFFRSGSVPEGTYKIEYYDGDKLLRSDYCTVAGGQITMLSLSPDRSLLAEAQPRQAKSTSQPPPPGVESRTEPPARAKAAPKTPAKKTTKKPAKVSADRDRRKSSASIALGANVEGARFEVDGKVLGAGNLTYSKIKPGKHQYTVSKDGFQPVSGTITLSGGEKRTLDAKLTPLTQNAKAEVFLEEDYYYSGLAALEEGNVETAISDLTEAITIRPSYGQAYVARGQAYALAREKVLAHDDYVRAAEIFKVKKNLNEAITAYNKALELNKKSVTAYLGRADAYLAKNEEIAAVADYEAVLKRDKRNAQAYFGLGEARFRQGRYKKASKHFRDAKSLDSENPLIYQYLMLCYLAMDDIKKVKKNFEKFEGVATESQMARLRMDSRFSAVWRIVERD